MQKFIAKLMLLILIFKFIVPTNGIGDVFAVSNNWDLNLDTEYTFDINTIEVVGGVGKLKLQLNHEGSIVNGAGGALLNQPQAIQVVGNYAYLTTRTSNTLEIVDISNPTNPIHVGSLSDGGAVTLRRAQDLVIDGNYAYITSLRDDAVEIVDISDPTNPIHISSIGRSGTIKLNGAIGIEKVGNYIYIASRVDDALEIIDVTDPANPIHAGAISDNVRLNGAEDVKISGNYAYVSAETDDSIQVIDISDPANPVFAGEITDGTGGATLNGASGLAINGNYLYVASNLSDAIEIIDISNPNIPTHVSSITNGGTTLLNGPENISIDGDYAYISSTVSDAIEVINISNPTLPVHTISITNGGTTLLNGAYDLKKIGNYIYVASDTSDALEILKISYSNTSPTIIPNNSLIYSGSIDKLTTIYGTGNQGNITYQISKDNGTTWYYLNGTSRITTISGVINSNTPAEINSEIQTFNGLAGGTGNFLIKAFLISNGVEQVELDEVKIDYTSNGINEIIDFEIPGGYTVTQGTFSRTTNNPQEGTTSIESGNNTNNSTSCFEVVRDVFTDSEIKFFKEVSSEANWDFLRFYIDGIQQGEWSGTVAWSQETYNIGNGNHTFEWCYEKDGSVSNLSDTAWVDYIEIIELPTPPVEIVVLDFEIAGGYTVTTTVTTPGPDWQRVTTEKYEGLYSIESQNRLNNTISCFERTQTVSPLDTGISFYKKVSSESGWDFLTFSIDTVEQNKWSGDVAWGKETYSLTPGTYNLEWCYTKDGSVSNLQDTAWVDLVSVTQDPPILSEIISVVTPTNDNTPDYTFNSTVAGNISYSGSCTNSTNTGAIIGDNTITFDGLADGIYTNCTIQVLASPQNSTILDVTNFTIDTTGIDITINYPLDTSTLPNGDFTIDTSYNDISTGVNTGSIVINMYKWNGSSYGTDISGTYIDFIGATINSTGSLHNVTNPGIGQYKIIFTIEDNIGNVGSATTVFDIASTDPTPPDITSINYASGSLLPGGNHNLVINYNDIGIGINITSDNIVLYKWNGTIWGADISATGLNLASKVITITGATYPTNNLDFGKYRYDFDISDNNSNISSTGSVFYIDKPEFIISTGSIDIGEINNISPTFSPEVTITVKTVGAAFNLLLNRNTDLIYDTEIINSFSGSTGYGYDKEVYTGIINTINNNEIIVSQIQNINIDGNLNTYVYKIKIGSQVDSNAVGGDYEGSINFDIDMSY